MSQEYLCTLGVIPSEGQKRGYVCKFAEVGAP